METDVRILHFPGSIGIFEVKWEEKCDEISLNDSEGSELDSVVLTQLGKYHNIGNILELRIQR